MARALLGLLGLAAVPATAAATGCSAAAFQRHDLMGGDMLPLGAGFRNATSAMDCCKQCSETPGCAFFATTAGGAAEVGPPHNCWLKSTAGTPQHNTGRVCGATGAHALPPAPPPPAPPFDGCFPKPTKPWCDVTKPFATRVASLVAALTLEERIAQIATYTPSTVPGVPRVGLPAFSYHSEGLHGLRNSFDTLGYNATLFPQVRVGAICSPFSP
jgi:hypothetical protein